MIQVTSCAPNTLSCGGNGGCQGSTPPLAYSYIQLFGQVLSPYTPGLILTRSLKLTTRMFREQQPTMRIVGTTLPPSTQLPLSPATTTCLPTIRMPLWPTLPMSVKLNQYQVMLMLSDKVVFFRLVHLASPWLPTPSRTTTVESSRAAHMTRTSS